MGQQVLALLIQLQAACQAADGLAEATVKQFRRHPDHQIITSFPRLGELTGARVLAEIGDDRSRFADARAIKAYAGAAPVTRASGKRLQVLARKVKNQRLAAVGYVWAFAALTASPGARAHYDRRKHADDHHAAAPTAVALPSDVPSPATSSVESANPRRLTEAVAPTT
jgi:transposase